MWKTWDKNAGRSARVLSHKSRVICVHKYNFSLLALQSTTKCNQFFQNVCTHLQSTWQTAFKDYQMCSSLRALTIGHCASKCEHGIQHTDKIITVIKEATRPCESTSLNVKHFTTKFEIEGVNEDAWHTLTSERIVSPWSPRFNPIRLVLMLTSLGAYHLKISMELDFTTFSLNSTWVRKIGNLEQSFQRQSQVSTLNRKRTVGYLHQSKFHNESTTCTIQVRWNNFFLVQ